ncbi:MAG: SpoIIE family protein phosphatase [Bacteroidales bacterium]|nr:SpoIIE family protein phosphatase [Bacteroidales bacterium]
MKNNKIKLKNSISGRLTLGVIIVSAIIFTLTCTVFIRMAANKVREEATKHAHSELSSTIYQIDAVLNAVEIAVENTAWLVPYRLASPEFMYSITERLLQNNNFICGSAVAFEPYYYASKGHYFSPYSYRDEKGEIKSIQLGTDTYDYHYMDWYQIPKLLNEPYWSEPYYDNGGGEMMMTTYSKPLYDEFGNLYAIITADLSLEWLTDLVGGIKAFDNAYNLMVSRNASFIVHPNRDLILNETIFSSTYGDDDESLHKMQEDMVNCRAGEVLRNEEGGKFFVFYSPVETTCWSVAIVCPRNELYVGVRRLRTVLIILGLLSLLLMLALSYSGIRKVVAPVEDFSDVAKKIANGEFNAELPQIHSQDELKELHDSFKYLQQSLTRYIDELKSTTANKERIESELRIAHQIQMGMIPKSFPAFPERDDISLAARLIPAKEVGGDLYDFFIDNDKLYFIIGDVSGKGIPASLVMAVTCRLFRSVASYLDKPEEIITSLNNSLSDGNESNMFCTAFLGILDLKTGKLNYCNAGHNAPYVVETNGNVYAMSVVPNLAMGLFSGFPYEGQETTLDSDKMLYLFTDGVNEAENRSLEQFGDERLMALLKQKSADMPGEIIETTIAEVQHHADGANQSDDITVMCMKYC